MNIKNKLFWFLGGGQDPDFAAWKNQVQAQGYASPTSDLTRIERFIKSFKRGGAGWSQTQTDIWNDTFGIWIAAMDSPDAWKVNIKSPTLYEATEEPSALNKNADGVSGNGIAGPTGSIANTNFTPNGIMVANDISAWGWFKSIVTGMFGTENSGFNRFRSLTNDFALSSTIGSHTARTDDGFWMINRDFSSTFKWWKGIQIAFSAPSFDTLPTVPMYFSGRNNQNTRVSYTTRTSIFGVSSAFIGNEPVIYALLDEYINGVWPFTKNYQSESTPSVVGSFDYQAFPDLIIGRYGSNIDKVFRCFKRGEDHNVQFDSEIVLQISNDGSLNWGSPIIVADSRFAWNVTFTGSSGTCNIVINGINYLATFNTSLTQTAADFVTTHSGTLSALGITLTSSAAKLLIMHNNIATTITVSVTLLTGNLNGSAVYYAELADSAFGEADDGTLMLFFTLNLVAGGDGRRRMFVSRSTDGGISFGNHTELTTDFEPSGQIAGPGCAITLSNGNILKPVYANTTGTGTRRAYIYQSTNDGLTWNQLSTVSTDDSADYEEPTLRLLPNGNILCILRSDPLNGSYYCLSNDSGTTWSAPSFQSPSTGKNAIAVNSDGLIIVIGRWPGNSNTIFARALISYAYQSDLTTWRWRFVDDENKWYMYSGGDWSSSLGFIFTYSRETNNNYLSPTKLIDLKYS